MPNTNTNFNISLVFSIPIPFVFQALLMEQDVSLTRQLLTLNETIEDLKNKKKYGYFCRPTSITSSDDLLER